MASPPRQRMRVLPFLLAAAHCARSHCCITAVITLLAALFLSLRAIFRLHRVREFDGCGSRSHFHITPLAPAHIVLLRARRWLHSI
jgi:hypothetical protein